MASESLLGHISAGALIPLILVVGGTLALREVDLEIHRNDLRTVQHQLENAQALIASSQERMSAWNGLHVNLGGCYATLEETDKAKKLRRGVEKQLDAEILDYLKLLQSTRERLMLTTIPELRLQDNRLFINARITSIMPEGVGFTHSQGIIRVKANSFHPACGIWCNWESRTNWKASAHSSRALSLRRHRRPGGPPPAARALRSPLGPAPRKWPHSA
ncbi:hypothetical protein [Verrucomicrobium spinosum]|uniref:hypothetical protein n=1 Tax=Verrucomicrobium spinosum TaxID=2736 RepID=UPI00094621A3|nr:hypothetical protein [Verrucomicrobium spinosum]